MSLEKMLVDALHQVDDFEPSPDLFARVERSIEADMAHRRRVRIITLALVVGVVAAAAFMIAVTTSGVGGLLEAPAWSLEVLTTLVSVAVVVSLGPSIRRFGQIYAADVFRMGPETGVRFLKLLDIAFYLVFFGLILAQMDVVDPGRDVVLSLDAWVYVGRLGSLMVLMGLSHALTLIALPLVGLAFSSTVRRARRLEAGSAAPPESPSARQADRVAVILIWVFAAVALVGGLMVVAFLGVSSNF